MEKKKSLMMIQAQVVVIFAFVALALGCDASKVSDQDAYDIGYGIGTLINNLDN